MNVGRKLFSCKYKLQKVYFFHHLAQYGSLFDNGAKYLANDVTSKQLSC